jgi:hypothetical protein
MQLSLQRRWQLGIIGVFIAMMAFGAMALMAQTARADHTESTAGVEPEPFAGNITDCSAIGSDFSFSTQTAPVDGAVYPIGPGTVTVDLTGNGTHLSFVSTIPLTGVYLKSGAGGNFYDYRPDGILADGNLWGSVNDQGQTQGISHVVFCADKLASDTVTELHLADETVVEVGASLPFGSVLHDKATVSGSGPTPTGTVTFAFYSNADCTGVPISSSVVALVNGVAHPSQSTGALDAGDYGFLATYSGNTLYDGSAESCEFFHIRGNPQAEIDVVKTANGLYDTKCFWDVSKSVSPETLNMFAGDSDDVDYTVTVTRDDCLTQVNYRISGTITVFNDSTVDPFEVTAVTDTLGGTIDCNGATAGTGIPFTLNPQTNRECIYVIDPATGSETTNTATATVDDIDVDSLPAAVSFANSGIVIDDSASLEDVFEDEAGVDLGDFTDDGSVPTYSRTFTCDADEGEHNNVVTLTTNDTGTTDTADATVDVNCYELTVTKDANESLTRTWTWTIDKSADQTDLLLAEGQLFDVNYEVEVGATSADSAWAVEGTITIANTTPLDATLTAVADVVSVGINATVDCGVTFPYVLLAGQSLECDYSAALPNADDRTNTATATRQNTPTGTTNVTGTAPVDFDGATVTQIDECVDVTDDNIDPDGVLGTVCAGDADKTFNYTLSFGAHPDADVILVCGDNSHPNVAAFETNDTGSTDDDTVTVTANVACDNGCTLTPGYWKTHSIEGPAPYDDAWQNLGVLEEDTPFFSSGQTYYQVLWTAPQGNSYYILAHAYIAAKLNILNGADSTAAVDAAIAYAENLFNTKTPAQVGTLKGAAKNAVITNAGILDAYNNGITGPGHCSEAPAN